MAMGSRHDVATANAAITAVDTVGLAQQMVNALVRVPFRRPLSGPAGPLHNLGQSVTREVVRSFMGYSSSLPIEEFRSIELLLDAASRVALAPVVALEGVTQQADTVAGVPGVWYRPRRGPVQARMLYLHGGGYVGTSPNMYAFFTARLSAVSGCEVFVADYRLAPEFPFPAGLHDAVAVLDSWHSGGVDLPVLLAGDSGGGGLVTSVMYESSKRTDPCVHGLVLFSPEVDLSLDQASINENAAHDILPWNIPTSAYLNGVAPHDAMVSALDQDVSGWPATFVCWGGDEMFRDAIGALVEHLDSSGVPVTAAEAPDMFHVFPILMPWAPQSRETFERVAAFVDSVVSQVR